MAKHSKSYQSKLEQCDRDRAYSLEEALAVLQSLPRAKFDESVELAFRLGIDPKQSDQGVRGALALPKGTGKTVRIAVVASGDAADKARAAGADIVGQEDLIAKIKEGWLEFDVLIATPAAMPQVRPLGKALGPRGLMPNPKTGTVTDDVGGAVREAKGGRVEFRADKGACVHVPVGKISFPVNDLVENSQAVIQALIRAKPATAKGVYIRGCTVSSTMSPGFRLDLKDMRVA
jgi:large subunit ribosomal protein L1